MEFTTEHNKMLNETHDGWIQLNTKIVNLCTIVNRMDKKLDKMPHCSLTQTDCRDMMRNKINKVDDKVNTKIGWKQLGVTFGAVGLVITIMTLILKLSGVL